MVTSWDLKVSKFASAVNKSEPIGKKQRVQYCGATFPRPLYFGPSQEKDFDAHNSELA